MNDVDDSSRLMKDFAQLARLALQGKQKDAFADHSFPEGAQLCGKCSTAAAVMLDGCMTCLNCGYSKCS